MADTSPPPKVNFVWLINKSGQLMYSRDFASPGGRVISENERITWASALHGFLALSKELSPVQDSAAAEIIETQEYADRASDYRFDSHVRNARGGADVGAV